MSNKGFITPLDTGLTKDSTYPNWVKIRPYGNKKRCKELEIKARGLLQKLIDDSKRLGLEHEVNQRKHPQSDGSLIIVYYHYENPVIDIFAPSGKGKKPRASLFQCDLYQDHADTPEDLDTQTITPIYFNVVDIPYWKEIPERHGNTEWRGDAGMITFDCTQNWGRGILNKRAWNDALYGPNGEDVGWPYDPRPQHAKRRGEISTIINNYATANIDMSDRANFAMNYKAVFEPDEFVHKQVLFINGNRVDVNFPYSNQLIMGACLHRVEGLNKTICIVVTQVFDHTIGFEGIAVAYEDVWTFDIANGAYPTPTKIHTMYYTNPQETNYITNKTDITSWAFNKEGTIGKALREQQYAIQNLFEWGPYHDPRFIDMNITYVGESVSIEHTEDSSVIAIAAEIVPGAVDLTPEERDLWIDGIEAWENKLYEKTKLDTLAEGRFGVLDLDIIWGADSTSGSTDIVEQYIAFGCNKKQTVSGTAESTYQESFCQTYMSHRNKIIWANKYDGVFKRTFNGDAVETLRAETYKPLSIMYIGGSPKFNIGFFIKVSVPEGQHTVIKNYTVPNEYCADFSYTILVQMICVFKGTEVDIGSPIEYVVPTIIDREPANATWATTPLADVENETFFWGPTSNFMLPQVEGLNSSMSSFSAPIPFDGLPHVGDFGGSIKCAPDGSHCVLSCSYMDMAKYIYPWHRHTHDINETTWVQRTDSMDALGVDPELQEAWNKYMINYAIIGPIPEEDDGTDSPTWALDGISLGGTGGSSPTIAGINSGSGSGSADFEGTGLDVRVEQLSRLLFNKKVTEDLPGGSSDNHSDYEFGIKEKDTNAFLPIGLYAFPSNEE